MRTIKFLGIAVAFAAVSVSANAQFARRFDHFSGINDLARLEARRIERHPMRQGAKLRGVKLRGAKLRGAKLRGARLRRGLTMRAPIGIRGHPVAGPPRGRWMMRAGRVGQLRAFHGGRHAGLRAGASAGLRGRFRAGARANASPEQQELTRQFREKRQALRAEVQAGTLTREQARAQMKAWTTEHRPKR